MPDVELPNSSASRPDAMTRREKAAVIVRLILSEGVDFPIAELPTSTQLALAEQIGKMRPITRATMERVVAEFIGELQDVGLSFPEGLSGALTVLDGKMDGEIVEELRQKAGVMSGHDPWEVIIEQGADRLLSVIEAESTEVAAVILSKLKVATAAEILGRLPGERARRLTYAVSMTGDITPETVERIGSAISGQLARVPDTAFEGAPVDRVGAILNFSPAKTREAVLEGLEATDREFADEVRKAIFTFANIPERVDPRDIPKIIRGVDNEVLITALAAAGDSLPAAAAFVLENMSKRMAEQLREEIDGKGKVKAADGEAAMTAVIASIRELESAGEIALVQKEEEEEEEDA